MAFFFFFAWHAHQTCTHLNLMDQSNSSHILWYILADYAWQNLCRLRMEGAGRERVRCVVRLELQWHLQICWSDQGSPSALRWERECNLECKVLDRRSPRWFALFYKESTYIRTYTKKEIWLNSVWHRRHMVIHCFASAEPDWRAWDWERNVHLSVHALW